MTTVAEVFDPDLMIAESDASEVFDAPGSVVYNVRSKLYMPSSKLKDGHCVVRAYTSEMKVDGDGFIEFAIKWKRGKVQRIPAPYHLLTDGVLFAMKKNKQRDSNGFGLNHELFALEWESSVILHFFNGKPCIFIASREEWMAVGEPGQRNQELQVFMEVPDHRRLPTSMVPASGALWLAGCVSMEEK